MNIKSILAKDPASLTDEEKDFLKAHASELSAEEKTKFAAVLEEGDTLNEDEVKALIAAKAQEVLKEQLDKMSDSLVAKFFEGVAAQRKKAIDTGKPAEDPARDKTREFVKALFAGDNATLKALTTSSSDDAKAGYLVPTELMNEVLRVATIAGVARRNMRYLPFTGPGNTRQIPTLGSSVSVYWTNEGAAKTGTQPAFNLVNQTLKKLAAIVPMTEEILEDSAINLTQLIGQLFAEAIALEEDAQFLAGTGSPWTGVLNNGSVNIKTMGTGDGISNLNADDLLDLIDALPSGAKAGAKFYWHPTVTSVIRKLKAATTGEYIFQQPGGSQPATVWNYPYEESDAMPAVSSSAALKKFIIFGNLQRAAVLGDKQQLRVKLLDQATITDADGETTVNLAEQDMVGIRVVERVGYVLALPSAVSVLRTGAAS